MKKVIPALLCLIAFLATSLYPAHESASNVPIIADTASADVFLTTEGDDGFVTMEIAATPTPQPTPAPTPEPAPLVKGDSSSEVTILQQKLLEWGFSSDEPDGIFGNDTMDAVKKLQVYLNIAEHSSALDWGELSAGATALTAKEIEAADPATLEYPITGEVYAKMRKYIFDGEPFPAYQYTCMEKDENDQVQRIQYRLTSLGYLYKGADGQFGTKTLNGLKFFQETNGLDPTGVADMPTQQALFSSTAEKAPRPVHEYKILVDVSDQRVYVYMWDGIDYRTLVQTFKCSTGVRQSPTPLGTYSETTGPESRWHYFKKFHCYAQYAWTIEGDILFHSVLFDKMDEKTVSWGSVWALGTRASHGCVRLSVADAKWLFENCIAGTTVVIQN